MTQVMKGTCNYLEICCKWNVLLILCTTQSSEVDFFYFLFFKSFGMKHDFQKKKYKSKNFNSQELED